MMRPANVFYKGELAGVLTQTDDGSFYFTYDEKWNSDLSKPSISLTFPKSEIAFSTDSLFPFFYHLLPEGTSWSSVCILGAN